MTDNLRIWNAVSKTDPKHTKSFKRAGGFSGTAIKPIWLTMRLTEQFGPAGSGWGMSQPQFQTVNAGEEILVFCTVGLWYKDGESNCMVYGVGGDKVLGKNKYGPFTNDEAFKASYTDAMSNAMKQIGMGADIHMGMFEDEKYVRETTREFEKAEAKPEYPPDGDMERLGTGPRGEDGKLLPTYDVAKIKKAADFADKLVQSLNLSPNKEAAKGLWRDNETVPTGKKKSPLQWLKDNSPGQFLRVQTAYENVVGLE